MASDWLANSNTLSDSLPPFLTQPHDQPAWSTGSLRIQWASPSVPVPTMHHPQATVIHRICLRSLFCKYKQSIFSIWSGGDKYNKIQPWNCVPCTHLFWNVLHSCPNATLPQKFYSFHAKLALISCFIFTHKGAETAHKHTRILMMLSRGVACVPPLPASHLHPQPSTKELKGYFRRRVYVLKQVVEWKSKPLTLRLSPLWTNRITKFYPWDRIRGLTFLETL